jgi:hypothetical protein
MEWSGYRVDGDGPTLREECTFTTLRELSARALVGAYCPHRCPECGVVVRSSLLLQSRYLSAYGTVLPRLPSGLHSALLPRREKPSAVHQPLPCRQTKPTQPVRVRDCVQKTSASTVSIYTARPTQQYVECPHPVRGYVNHTADCLPPRASRAVRKTKKNKTKRWAHVADMMYFAAPIANR